MNKVKQNDKCAQTSVLRQLAVLQNLNLEQLQEKWLDLYGSKPPNYKKQFLIKRLAYRIQELYYGGLSESAKLHLANVAANDPMVTLLKKKRAINKEDDSILPGTRFVRIWKGRRYEVIVRENGFEFEGKIYRSVSAVASKITGAHWNGKVFFGLKPEPNKKKRRRKKNA